MDMPVLERSGNLRVGDRLGEVQILHDRRVESGAQDALLSAIVDKLPPASTPWPAADRQAWLTMMNNAFDVVYGAAKGETMPRATAPARSPARKSQPRKAVAAKRKPQPVTGGPRFFIDRQGIARRAGGDRIMPAEVAGILVDKRGQTGDLATITWADDSMGIPKGLQLDIGISDGQD